MTHQIECSASIFCIFVVHRTTICNFESVMFFFMAHNLCQVNSSLPRHNKCLTPSQTPARQVRSRRHQHDRPHTSRAWRSPSSTVHASGCPACPHCCRPPCCCYCCSPADQRSARWWALRRRRWRRRCRRQHSLPPPRIQSVVSSTVEFASCWSRTLD